MIIKSRFKDYYDYVAHAYGGGDPKIVYARERIVAPRMEGGQVLYENTVEVPPELVQWIPNVRESNRDSGNLRSEYEGLVVAGRWFLLHKSSEMVTEYVGKVATRCRKTIQDWHVLHVTNSDRDYRAGMKRPHLVDLSRHVNAPVFRIRGDGWDRQAVQGLVPNLGQLGVPQYLNAEQCYQEIAMFLANTIRVNPDETPESKPPLTDVEKAMAHGFDKRASFRHRK